MTFRIVVIRDWLVFCLHVDLVFRKERIRESMRRVDPEGE